MAYTFLRPSKCAEEVVRDIQGIVNCLNNNEEDRVHSLLRQLMRDVYEHCAQVAETYTSEHDPDGHLDGERLGDLLAEEFRKYAEERRNRRRV